MKAFYLSLLLSVALPSFVCASTATEITQTELDTAVEAATTDLPELQAATTQSRVAKAMIRGLLVAIFAAQNLRFGDHYSLQESAAIGIVAGTGSGVLQYYNHVVQRALASSRLAAWLARKLNVRQDSLPAKIMEHFQQLLNGYALDAVYMVYFNAGVYVIAPETFPDASTFLAKTLGVSLLGVLSQTIAETSFAQQVKTAKQQLPQLAAEIQDRADYVVAAWSILATGFIVGAVLDVSYAVPALWGMAMFGTANYIFAFYQNRSAKKAISSERGSCWQSFFAPWTVK